MSIYVCDGIFPNRTQLVPRFHYALCLCVKGSNSKFYGRVLVEKLSGGLNICFYKYCIN